MSGDAGRPVREEDPLVGGDRGAIRRSFKVTGVTTNRESYCVVWQSTDMRARPMRSV